MSDQDQDEPLTPLQMYLFDLYEEYRHNTKQHNPSDSKFARWLGLQTATYNHWANGYRSNPDLKSLIAVSQSLVKRGIKDPYKIFRVMGLEPVRVGHNRQLNYLIEFWNYLPPAMKAEIDEYVQKMSGGGQDEDKETPQE